MFQFITHLGVLFKPKYIWVLPLSTKDKHDGRATFVVTAVLEEPRAPEPGEPGDPGEPGLSGAEGGGLDRLVFVEPEKASLKLGFCLPEKLDFARISLSSGSFTGHRSDILISHEGHRHL